MERRILDTSVLIAGWRKNATGLIVHATIEDARSWADEVVRLRRSDAIVTPVKIEFLVGTRTGHELRLARAFLEAFRIIDGGEVQKEDFTAAINLAERIPPDGNPRQFGDCLIRALAQRLRHDVDSTDTRFPRRLWA